ncbi:MAG: hypothetical protein O3A00_06470 [Planctomycetota bacterium]|nr:hypothetical protein [Planctomycetota bacterium]
MSSFASQAESIDSLLGEFVGTWGMEDEAFAVLGNDPNEPTGAKPGSEEKVDTLAARYALGVPLWNNDDRIDHTPADVISTFEPLSLLKMEKLA